MRRHLVCHWRVRVLVVVAVVVVNELVDRRFFDHQEHIDGVLVLALLILVLAFFGSYLVSRLRPRGGV